METHRTLEEVVRHLPREVPAAATSYGLDFDDAYPYAAAKILGLSLIRFDADFDRTDLIQRTPKQFLEKPE